MYPEQIKLLKILNEIKAGTRDPMTVNDLRNELHIFNPPSKLCSMLDDLKEKGYINRLHYDSYSTTETIRFELSLQGINYQEYLDKKSADKEEQLSQLNKQHKHEWKIAVFNTLGGAIAGLITSIMFWLITK